MHGERVRAAAQPHNRYRPPPFPNMTREPDPATEHATDAGPYRAAMPDSAPPPVPVTVIGNGAFGSVLACVLHETGQRVRLWGPNADRVRELARTRRSPRYLPELQIPDAIDVEPDDDTALADAELLVSAIPTQGLRAVWSRLRPHVPADAAVVSVTKGLERDTRLLPTGILRDVLGDTRPYAVLSGPSVADELARRLPATVTVATPDAAFAGRLQHRFTTDAFRVYTHDDLLGVELAGALKNVIALAAGIVDGLDAGINAKSALLARGLAEITRLGVAMGARPETFFGVTGVGDLATTCFSPTGRNRSAGEQLGRGAALDTVLDGAAGVVEGVPTAASVIALADAHGVEMPIAAAVHAVLFDNLAPRDAVRRLMTRDPKPERVG